ncbi:sulfotransferase [Temperatibacter marinus]|uniref:Sulfotransferase n=1 Tax=Temperatibacter marinus TaxID=1456591 RepID=A0AA52H9I0_9PROT|nr:sulfotransferase [Temperatibacter marinus]WND03216.1 sulfotransferase [Temperatibacter marinus]
MTEKKRDIDIGRSKDFEKDASLEDVLSTLNTLIKPHKGSQKENQYPPIFIVGCPRSGSTLLLQWLASLGHFSYPSNLLARFYANPYFGGLVQNALIDYDEQNILNFDKSIDYQSNLGRSTGALAPSEFWYFWRQHFSLDEISVLTESAKKAVDKENFKEALAGIEEVYNKPTVMKAMILNWDISFLAELVPNALFLNVERSDFHAAQSLYYARTNFFNDVKRWYSFKPPEYEQLKEKDPLEQVAGQVIHTKRAVIEELAKINPSNQLTLNYKDFCSDPAGIFHKITAKLALLGYDQAMPYSGPTHYTYREEIKLSTDQEKQLNDALEKYRNK